MKAKAFKAIWLCSVRITILVIIGNLWFHMVEGLLGWIKGLFTRRREPPAWHPLAPEDEKKDGD